MKALVSISEAARLTGMSRRTIQRHVASGRLSMSQDGAGQDGIQISELLRVYGPLVGEAVSQSASGHAHATVSPDVAVDVLKKENEILRELIKEKQDHIESLKKSMLLLEVGIENKKKSLISRIFGG